MKIQGWKRMVGDCQWFVADEWLMHSWDSSQEKGPNAFFSQIEISAEKYSMNPQETRVENCLEKIQL